MKAENTIPSPCPKSNLTRRGALYGAAACGALALPAGAAMATSSDADLELVQLWHEYIDLWTGPHYDDQTRDRLSEIREAITDARPESMLGLAVQCRYLEHDVDVGACDSQIELLGAMGATLARLAGAEVRHHPEMLAEGAQV